MTGKGSTIRSGDNPFQRAFSSRSQKTAFLKDLGALPYAAGQRGRPAETVGDLSGGAVHSPANVAALASNAGGSSNGGNAASQGPSGAGAATPTPATQGAPSASAQGTSKGPN